MVSGHASQPAIYAVIFTSTSLAILAVALRLYTRIRIVRKPDWDDLLSASALGFTCVFTVCVALESVECNGPEIEKLIADMSNSVLRTRATFAYPYQIRADQFVTLALDPDHILSHRTRTGKVGCRKYVLC